MKYGIGRMAALVFLLPLMAKAEGNIAAGQQKSAACAACHGVRGQGLAPIYPPLAGLPVQRLMAAMQGYKNGTRQGGQAGIMSAYVAPLSDQDMANLAAYYASMTPVKKP